MIYISYITLRERKRYRCIVSLTFSIFLFKSRMSGGGKDGTGTECRD
nr:MAG TPA: hypothetical protein [Caudoviricetes sp.]